MSYALVPTKPNSDDDESEENVFLESNMNLNTTFIISGIKRNYTSTSKNTRLYGTLAAICTILVLTLLVSGFIITRRTLLTNTVSTTDSFTLLSTSSALTRHIAVTTRAADGHGREVTDSIITPELSNVISAFKFNADSTTLMSPFLIGNDDNDNIKSSSNHQTDELSPESHTISWHQDIFHALTELSIVVYDINHDGIPDLIFDVITERLEIGKYLVCPNKDNSCTEDFGFTPCRIHLVALDGQNGSLVWEKWIEFSPFAANCEHDLNRDGIHDCTFSGRQGSFAALNPVDGSFLWYIDPAVTFPTYNYYCPLFIRDFDGDEVIDIIVTHGGDPVYTHNDKDRSTGFIFVVSGRTGQQLSDRIPIPDGHETYSNPIAYSMAGNIDVILFGSGGETIAGSLWAITVESLQENVNAWKPNRPQTYDINKSYIATQCLTDEEVRQMRPKFEKGTFKYADDKEDWLSECPVWNTDTQPLWNPYKICAYEIIPAGKTGTIIPPVIIDYNNDGIKDLLVSQFNDHVMMMDGATTSIVWDHYAEDTQSYSIPSPLNFNNDNIPDYLYQFNKGKWMMYDYSYMAVIDGSNGELLWSLNCLKGAMSSAITIKSSKRGHDGMLFFGSGCENEFDIVKKKAEDETDFRSKHNVCLTTHWDVEKSICMTDERNKRHANEESNDESIAIVDEKGNRVYMSGGDTLPVDSGKKQIFRPPVPDIDLSEFIIPADIWEVRDETDSFPDPWSNTESFFEDYCKVRYVGMNIEMYFLTPNMIKLEKVAPLIVTRPYVYKSPSYDRKRHSSVADKEHVPFYSYSRKDIRCAHIVIPLMVATTPTVGDFNNDGKLDVAISTSYGAHPDKMYYFWFLHLPKVSVDTFTIEDKVKEVFGSDIEQVVDFTLYYPADKQPWRKYMGSRGNGVYELTSP